MRVAVSGATGTIGRALVDALGARGDEVTPLSRSTLELLATECPLPEIVKEAERVLA